jgi:hypothetical protein
MVKTRSCKKLTTSTSDSHSQKADAVDAYDVHQSFVCKQRTCQNVHLVQFERMRGTLTAKLAGHAAMIDTSCHNQVGRKAATAAHPSGDANPQQAMTQVLMKTLPDLLKKYTAEPAITAHLAGCVSTLQLDMYGVGQEGRQLEGVLKLLEAAFGKMGDVKVLENCAKGLVAAAEHGPASLQVNCWSASRQFVGCQLASVLGQVAGSVWLEVCAVGLWYKQAVPCNHAQVGIVTTAWNGMATCMAFPGLIGCCCQRCVMDAWRPLHLVRLVQ